MKTHARAWLGLMMLILLLIPVCLLASLDDFDVTGDVRLRLRFTDSDYTGRLAATYGEEVRRGFSFRHRAVFEVSHSLTGNFRVGGLIRISNEPAEVIRSGPDYFSSQFGSGFIAYETQDVTARLGYFRTAFTPLTLMRWDLKDDPEGGGGVCAVCGGPGVAGAILGETLEELGPEITFEGLKVRISPNEALELQTYLARPSITGETYPVITFGLRAAVRRYLAHAGSFLNIGFVALRSQDDHKTLRDGSEPLGRVFENNVYGLTWDIPLNRWLGIEGEWVVTSSEGHNLADPWSPGWDMEGRGGRFVLSFRPTKRWLLDLAYLYLSPNWDSYFRGLSYNANRRGVRFRCEYGGERLVVAVFAKFVSTIDDVPFGPTAQVSQVIYPTLSARAYYEVVPDLNLGLAAIFSGEGTSGDLISIDVENKRITWLGTLTYEISRNSSINLGREVCAQKK